MTIELNKAETKRLYVILNTFVRQKVPGANGRACSKTAQKFMAQFETQIRKDRKNENK